MKKVSKGVLRRASSTTSTRACGAPRRAHTHEALPALQANAAEARDAAQRALALTEQEHREKAQTRAEKRRAKLEATASMRPAADGGGVIGWIRKDLPRVAPC